MKVEEVKKLLKNILKTNIEEVKIETPTLKLQVKKN